MCRVQIVFGAQATFTVDDWGVERVDALTRQGYAWAALSGVDRLPGQLVFSLGKAGFLPMATTALLPGELEQILAMAANNDVRV
jgi:hypothetical protein